METSIHRALASKLPSKITRRCPRRDTDEQRMKSTGDLSATAAKLMAQRAHLINIRRIRATTTRTKRIYQAKAILQLRTPISPLTKSRVSLGQVRSWPTKRTLTRRTLTRQQRWSLQMTTQISMWMKLEKKLQIKIPRR